MCSAQAMLRYKIERASCLSPHLCQLGWAIFAEPVHDGENLPAHVHETAYEICYIAQGTVDWWVEQKQFEVDPGYVFITFPGEKHGGLHDVMNPCELFWIQVEFPRGGNMQGLSQSETAILADKFARIEQHCFPSTQDTPVLFKRIVDEHRRVSEHSSILVRTGLIELLIAVIHGYEVHRQRNLSDPAYSKPIRKAMALIDEHLEEEIKMDDIAQQVGLSMTSFYRQFHEEVFMTPGEYLIQRRIHRAKILLCDPAMSITTIAHALGYSSSQYFATAFKRVTGVTPRAYRATSLIGPSEPF